MVPKLGTSHIQQRCDSTCLSQPVIQLGAQAQAQASNKHLFVHSDFRACLVVAVAISIVEGNRVGTKAQASTKEF